ncbi:MAG: histone deacetylase [Syntrophales bacterium]|jgi:acetoin utilization deacetylase AcuC-like enzyme|nr:histone deacetylase [Syntrophales bacterium]
MAKNTGIVKNAQYVRHGGVFSQPESPERLSAIYDMLENPDMSWKFNNIDARYATRRELEMVHLPSYIDAIAATAGKNLTMLDPDTAATADTFDAARLAAGGFIAAIDSVVSGETDNAFAMVRPPGHHAAANAAAGFCIFNNIAIGARYALDRLGMKRVLIVDWDLHHGNGTQQAFYEDDNVLYFSTHQSPAYPWTGRPEETGKGEGAGYTINVPLRPGAGDAMYIRVFQDILLPVAHKFRPEIILVSAGFDPYEGDPLGEMKVTPAGFAGLARILLDLAEEVCGGRVVAALEGGYNVLGLVKCVRAVLLEFLGETRATQEAVARLASKADLDNEPAIENVRKLQAAYWPILNG